MKTESYEMSVNRKELAKLFGVAPTTVDAWVSRGCPVILKDGKGRPSQYDTADVFKWCLRTQCGLMCG
ncbi:MAG: terminase small subunit [Thermodesulfobacteriota bacterium]